ncbi:MAG: class I SAM-dependent DNA methyltransferase, partial [Bacteroidota bacterium]
IIEKILAIKGGTINLTVGVIKEIPICIRFKEKVEGISKFCLDIYDEYWAFLEGSFDFNCPFLWRNKSDLPLEEVFNAFKNTWSEKFFQLHAKEEELNRIFIEIYGLEEELTPEVDLQDITILQQELGKQYHFSPESYEKMSVDEEILAQVRRLEGQRFASTTALNKALKTLLDKEQLKAAKTDIANSTATRLDAAGKLIFDDQEVVRQLISYAVGCMFGRYSLDQPGLILANQGEGLEEYVAQLDLAGFENLRGLSGESTTPDPAQELPGHPRERGRFMPDDDNIIPVLAGDYFDDDIVARFKEWLRVAFGEAHYAQNLAFIETALGQDLRRYFVRDFYEDHLRRYQKRPIYWLFSSPDKGFQALVYLHRYRPDTLSRLLNEYLREFQVKLKAQDRSLAQVAVMESTSATEKNRAQKQRDLIARQLHELEAYERDHLYPLATQRIELDLDDGVKVNYGKLGRVLYPVKGLNK